MKNKNFSCDCARVRPAALAAWLWAFGCPSAWGKPRWPSSCLLDLGKLGLGGRRVAPTVMIRETCASPLGMLIGEWEPRRLVPLARGLWGDAVWSPSPGAAMSWSTWGPDLSLRLLLAQFFSSGIACRPTGLWNVLPDLSGGVGYEPWWCCCPRLERPLYNCASSFLQG